MSTDIKKIELFLPNGDPTGCLICDVANWDGKIFRIPKALINTYADRSELQYTGIYFLIGNGESMQVYIGEAENLYRRILQHLDEDFWNECVMVVKKENAINKAHAKYLENSFYQLAKDVGRCVLTNSCTPTKSSISEADEAVMNDFVIKVRAVIGALGYRFLTPIIDTSEQSSPQFEIARKRSHPDLNAKGMITNEGFIVMKGSTSMEKFSPASSKSLHKKWQELREQGIIKNNKFTRNYLASSPSMAASMVLGYNANGLTEWKTFDNVRLKDYLKNDSKEVA